MRAADLEAVSKLAGQLVRQHHGFDQKRFFLTDDPESGYRWWLGEQLQNPDVVLLVAEVDGAVAGYVYGGLEDRDWARLVDAHGAIHDIYVDDAFRRRGLAKQLMTAALDAFHQKGVKQVLLGSATPNVQAQKLFASLGFRPTMVEMTHDQ